MWWPRFAKRLRLSQSPEGWEKNVYTHYDNPSRRDKRLYAFDIQGNLIGRK